MLYKCFKLPTFIFISWNWLGLGFNLSFSLFQKNLRTTFIKIYEFLQQYLHLLNASRYNHQLQICMKKMYENTLCKDRTAFFIINKRE